MRRSSTLTILAVLLAASALAGCTGGSDGSEPETRVAHCEEGTDLHVLVAVDNARPEPGDEVRFSLSLRNERDTPVPVPEEKFILQLVNDADFVFGENAAVEPRWDMPTEVQPNETVFLTRVSLVVPPHVPAGTYRTCANGGDFHGVLPFTVFEEDGIEDSDEGQARTPA